MGYENRDYFRDGSYSRQGGGQFLADSPACRLILFVTVIFYLGQIFLTRQATPIALEGVPNELRELIVESPPRISVVEEWLQLDTEKIKQGQVWRLLTSIVLHDRISVFHILFNMLFLYWFGRTMESMYGSREFLIFYIVAGLVASLAYVGIQLLTGERNPAIGASGAVMGVVCLFTMWYPRHTINVMFVFPVEMRFLLILYVIYDLHPILLMLSGTNPQTGVAHAAHLGGLAFGFLYYRNTWRLEPIWNRFARLFGAQRKIRIHKPSRQVTQGNSEPDERNEDWLDSQMDTILAKISIEGEASLTDKERKVLLKASKRLRSRD